MDQEEKQRNYDLASTLLSEQKFAAAAISGAVAMILAAGLYGAMASGGIAFSFMAAGIGVAIGFTMRFLGRGIDTIFAVVASVYAVLGCLLGNLFASVIYVAQVNSISAFDVFIHTPPNELASWIAADMQFVDLIFWIVGQSVMSPSLLPARPDFLREYFRIFFTSGSIGSI